MATIKSTDHSNIYNGFLEIPGRDFSRQIYYVEKHLDLIFHMDDYPRIDVLHKYIKALFEIGHYKKCLNYIDSLITDLFEADFHPNEKEVLCDLLVRKACSNYNLSNFQAAEHIIKEIVKIDPTHQRAVQILHSIKLRRIRQKLSGIRSISIVMLFFGLCITCVDLLVIQNFYPEKAYSTMVFRNAILMISGGGLLSLEVWAYLKSKSDSRAFHQSALDKKSIAQ